VTSASLANTFPVYDFETYLDLEANASNRNEYFYGHILAMAGGTDSHSATKVAATLLLGRLLASKPCYIRDSDMKIATPNSNAAFYPDLSVFCNQKPDRNATAYDAPSLIVEVLSPSTRRYDLTTKRKEYFRIPSLRHYLLIDSETPSVLLYTRDANQTWPKDPQSFTDPKATIPLTALKINLKLKDLYRQTGLL